MPTLLTLALLLNVVVLVPVVFSLLANRPGAVEVFGGPTQARGILLSIYLSILVVSGGLLVHTDLHATAGLLAVQVIYKVTTPFTVGSWRNPVVISNLLIATFHVIALWRSWSVLAT